MTRDEAKLIDEVTRLAKLVESQATEIIKLQQEAYEFKAWLRRLDIRTQGSMLCK
jgi:hypothetical protein